MRWWTIAPPSDTNSREWSIRSTQYEPPIGEWENDRRRKNLTIPSMKVELTFHDAAGMWRRRTAEGSLVEITEPDAPHSADGNDWSVEDFQPANDESSSA